ncbi:MAG TPA: GYF domain-containing protein, partial [Phycisphaerae bacterium]|nr:GYF domain-containing protein [Phycisphaerae bacterium]
MGKQFWTRREGQTWGPFTGEQLKELTEQGRVAPTDLVSLDQKSWTPAKLVRGLFDAGKPPAAAPAPQPPAPPEETAVAELAEAAAAAQGTGAAAEAPTGAAQPPGGTKRKSRKRIFILIGAVLVAAVAAAVVCWVWLAGPDKEVIAALEYAPPGTVGVLHVDFQALAGEVFKELRRREADLPKEVWDSLERVSSKIEAVDLFIVAGKGQQPQPFVVVHGDLTAKDVQDAAKFAARVSPLREVGSGQYEVPIEGERIRVIFGGEAKDVPAGVILAGPEELLTSKRVSKLGAGDADWLRELLGEVDGSAPIWGGIELPEGLDDDAPQTVVGHVDPREGGEARVRMSFRGKRSARKAAGEIGKLLEGEQSPVRGVFRIK